MVMLNKKKMRLLIIIFALTHATMPCLNMTGGRDALLGCLSTLVDTNSDGVITKPEAHAFLRFPGYLNGIFLACDVDKSGNLTMSDWNATNGCCRTSLSIVTVCQHCERAGWEVH